MEHKNEHGGTKAKGRELRAGERIVLSSPPATPNHRAAAPERRAAARDHTSVRTRMGRALKLFSVAAIWVTAAPLLLGAAAAAWYAVDPVSFSDAWLGTAAFVEGLVWSPTTTPT